MTDRRENRGGAAGAFLAAWLMVFAAAGAEPVGDGLVLWLDAGDTATLEDDGGGRVGRWLDKSPQQHEAVQPETSARPRRVAAALGGRSVVRFEGRQFLDLGRAERLGFRPGDAFTFIVVYRVSGGQHGTWLAQGGGSADQRAYQFYLAPGRLGAIAYGTMKEAALEAGPGIAAMRCDGSTVELFAGGEELLKFDAGRATSDADVLLGARRENADNTGIFYPFSGDLAELLVYGRALAPHEHQAVGRYLADKYGFITAYASADVARRLSDELSGPLTGARLQALADAIRRADGAAVLDSVLDQKPAAALNVAELLVRIAERNQLSEPLAEIAGELLAHESPFVRGMAEWAITMKVGGENNGQSAVWPKADPPHWYEAWMSLPPAALLEADWVRQAVTTEIHRDAGRLLAAVDQLLARAERMADEQGLDPASSPPAALQAIRRQMAQRIAAAAAAGPDDPALPPAVLADLQRLWLGARQLHRQYLIAHAPLDFDQLLFIRRFAPHTVRNITREYSWRHKPGGDIDVLAGLGPGGQVRSLIDGRLGPGNVRGMDLWWDGDRIVFAYARQAQWPPHIDTTDSVREGNHTWELRQRHEPLRLFEVAVDGSGLAQLTDHPYWNDFEPTYAADGSVVFSSDRAGLSQQCGAFDYDHTAFNLYRLSPAGDIRRLTAFKDTDRYPQSLDNGLIAYTRWEYQERHFMEVHSIWTIRPDGTMADALYKQHLPAPLGLRNARSIPGTGRLVAVAAGHHSYANGPVCIVAPQYGMNAVAGLRIVTPGVVPDEGRMAGRAVSQGGVVDRGGRYEAPWPLSDRWFLAAYAYARPNCTAPAGVDSNGFALYLIDVYGNRELVYRDRLMSCTMPIPLRPRPRPPLFPAEEPASAHATGPATGYVADVYEGLEGIPRGAVKYLRIAQHVGWPLDPERGKMPYISGNAWQDQFGFWSWSPVRVIGDVPVEPDGSAHFEVPADTAVYFQALDDRHMELRRMRSMVSFQPGETRGCRGCHESQAATPMAHAALPRALTRPADKPLPPPWGADRLLGYEWLVQPILDRHCTTCHGSSSPDGGLDFTSHVADDGYVQSFRTIFGRSPGAAAPGRTLVAISDRFSGAEVTRPLQFGSHQSPLVRVLLDDDLHRREVQLAPEEWYALVTWIDANAPYHDRFYNKRPADGGPPVRNVTLAD